MPAAPDTVDRVKHVLRASLKLDPSAEFGHDTPLLGGEYDLDSLDILLLITNIEREFNVSIREGTMNRQAFTTIGTLSDYVEQLRQRP